VVVQTTQTLQLAITDKHNMTNYALDIKINLKTLLDNQWQTMRCGK